MPTRVIECYGTGDPKVFVDGNGAPRVTWGELFATLYHNLGIDSHRTTLPDLIGRPRYLAGVDANPLPELV
jgi:hypothetical protein